MKVYPTFLREELRLVGDLGEASAYFDLPGSEKAIIEITWPSCRFSLCMSVSALAKYKVNALS